MPCSHLLALLGIALALNIAALTAPAALPPPPTDLFDWPMSWSPDDPGALAADALIDKPAGRNGPVTVRDGHFFNGTSRLKFWGVNMAFAANFPTHAQADAIARRLARFGVNAVRFHHMDNQPFPSGIFADTSLEALSPEALDRLDYFLAALKAQGIYANINLHVSRPYHHYHRAPDGKDGPRVDKLVDLFDPELIAAQKKYASDLLGHVNAYTKSRYADEPAVAMVEINNENSLFMWDARATLAALPAPYADELKRQWNAWLAARYGTREKLRAAWSPGEEAIGEQMMSDGDFNSLKPDFAKKVWNVEIQGTAMMGATFDRAGAGDGKPRGAVVAVSAVDGTDWHLQLIQPALRLVKGRAYTLSFSARADKPVTIGVSVGQAHQPWQALGLAAAVRLEKTARQISLPFTAMASDDNARLCFSLGQETTTIYIPHVELRRGGRSGLTADEDPAKGSIATDAPNLSVTPHRSADWYEFLQQTEEKFYVDMKTFLKNDVGVKCPVTGTIAFCPLNLRGQAKMDFVDGHGYWDHPRFPRKQWDSADWIIRNTPMVDEPERATLWPLACARVEGLPFTVTEYNHSAPNEWQAECVPVLASYAAAQDWDAVFLFAYSHGSDFEKQKMNDFFNIEGNVLKLPLMPMGARIFLGGAIEPRGSRVVLGLPNDLIAQTAASNPDLGAFARTGLGQKWQHLLSKRMSVAFDPASEVSGKLSGPDLTWTSAGAGTGTGRFACADDRAAIFTGFAAGSMPIQIGPMKIESLQTPFATLVLASADPTKTIEQSDRLLLTAVARALNHDMQWDTARTSVSNKWGNAPPQVERVRGTISIKGQWRSVRTLSPAGEPTGNAPAQIAGDHTTLQLGTMPAIAYEISR